MSTTLKAKRTHAKRSCEICKVRKTRCELPDLEIPISSEPLPSDKSCHRCRVLGLPCVVEDRGRKDSIKRAREDDISLVGNDSPGGIDSPDGAVSKAGPSRPAPRKAKRQNTGGASKGRSPRKSDVANLIHAQPHTINHSLDLLHSLHPGDDYDDDPEQLYGGPSTDARYTGAYDPFVVSEPYHGKSKEPEVSPSQIKTMKLHGRALELVAAMLKVAYGRTKMNRGRPSCEDVDLSTLLDQDLRNKVESGYSQLQAFHPYLDPLTSILPFAESESLSEKLLLAVIIYLSTLSIQGDTRIHAIRAVLGPYIMYIRDRVILASEFTFPGIQALEILAQHAPLGLLPLQTGNPSNLVVARGQLYTAETISTGLGFPTLIRSIYTAPLEQNWCCADIWLWASLRVQEACFALEDESPKKPSYLLESFRRLSLFFDTSFEANWGVYATTIDSGLVVGRLAITDRLLRLGDIFDSLERMRAVLDNASQDPECDVVTGITDEMNSFTSKMDQLDIKHNHILSIISPHTNGLETGWLAYRSIRQKTEVNKVYQTGLRYLIASTYLAGHIHAFPNLPESTYPSQRVSYAIGRATNPRDVMAFLMRNDRAVQAVWQWGFHRGNVAEQVLIAFVDAEETLVGGNHHHLSTSGEGNTRNTGDQIQSHTHSHSQSLTPKARRISTTGDPNLGESHHRGTKAYLTPLHSIMASTIEASQTLMEMQAGSAIIRRNIKTANRFTRPLTWLSIIRAASGILRTIGTFSVPSSPHPLETEDGELPTESLANACSNVLGSMCRMADEWGKTSPGLVTSIPTSQAGTTEAEINTPPMDTGISQLRKSISTSVYDDSPIQTQTVPPPPNPNNPGGGIGHLGNNTNVGSTGIIEMDGTTSAAIAAVIAAESNSLDPRLANSSPTTATAGGGANGISSHHPQQQQYMDTSDRWMASDHQGQGQGQPTVIHDHPSYHQHHHHQQQQQQQQQQASQYPSHQTYQDHFQATTHYPPTHLDLVLSQMFNYSGQGVPSQAHPGQHAQHGGHGHGHGHGHQEYVTLHQSPTMTSGGTGVGGGNWNQHQ